MNKSVEVLYAPEIEGMSSALLQDQVEKLQEETLTMQARLAEAYELLEDFSCLEDSEDLEEMLQRVRTFLENKPFSLSLY